MRLQTILPVGVLAALSLIPTLPAQNLPDLQIFNQLRPRASFLGVGILDVDADRVSRLKLADERGVEVTIVEEGSPADIAGMKVGDVLLTYNGETILGSQQFVRLVRETPVGRKVRLSLWRNGKQQTLTVTTASPRPVTHVTEARGNAFGDSGDLLLNLSPEMTLMRPNADIPTIIMAWNSSRLGIECEPVNAQLAQFFGVKQGVLVRSVQKGSVGEKAGFKAGDVLTSVGNQPVRTPDDLRRILRDENKPAAVAVTRDRKELTLSIAAVPEREQ